MKTQMKTLLVATSLVAASLASASPFRYVPVPATSVEACIAEVDQRADYTGGSRVVHNVDVDQRRSVGHELRISTLVMGEADGKALREYVTVCTVTPKHAPLAFTMSEAP